MEVELFLVDTGWATSLDYNNELINECKKINNEIENRTIKERYIGGPGIYAMPGVSPQLIEIIAIVIGIYAGSKVVLKDLVKIKEFLNKKYIKRKKKEIKLKKLKDIKSVGPVTEKKLKKGKIKSPIDLLNKSKKDLVLLGIGKKRSKAILMQVENDLRDRSNSKFKNKYLLVKCKLPDKLIDLKSVDNNIEKKLIDSDIKYVHQLLFLNIFDLVNLGISEEKAKKIIYEIRVEIFKPITDCQLAVKWDFK